MAANTIEMMNDHLHFVSVEKQGADELDMWCGCLLFVIIID